MTLRRQSNLQSALQRGEMILNLSFLLLFLVKKWTTSWTVVSCGIKKQGWTTASLALSPLFSPATLLISALTPLSVPQSWSARAAITKYHRLVTLTTAIYFSQFGRIGSPNSRWWQGQFHSEALSLGLQAAATLCAQMTTLLIKNTNPLRTEPDQHDTTGPNSKYHHTRVRASTYACEADTDIHSLSAS